MSEFARRVAFAAVAIPAVGAVVWLGGLALAALLGIIAGLAAWEFFRIAEVRGVNGFKPAGVLLAVAVPIVVHTNFTGATLIPVDAAVLTVLAIFAAAIWRRGKDRPLSAVAATLFAVIYTGGMLSYGYELRYHRFVLDATAGTALVGFPLVLTWATDTGGYAFGKWFGRTKLMPSVSPGKTMAGAWGGLVLAVAAAWLYTTYVLHPYAHLALPLTRLVAFAIIISIVAQIGDLAESVLKREAGVKDSSRIIPGHGGVLDRLDSLLFVLPVAYVLLGEMLVVAP